MKSLIYSYFSWEFDTSKMYFFIRQSLTFFLLKQKYIENAHSAHYKCMLFFPRVFFFFRLLIPFFKKIFIYFWLHRVFFAGCGLCLVVADWRCSRLWCTGFSLWWLFLLQSAGCRGMGFGSGAGRLSGCGLRLWGMWASVVVAQGLSYSAACGIFLDQGSNLCPLALAGRLLSTAPPGKSTRNFFLTTL